MPTVDPVDFTRLAEAVSDGDAVDWAAAGSHASPSDRRVLDALKVVSEIAGLHRTMPPSAGERPAELYAGDVWSHLTLREIIGRGAYGVVYRAWDPQLDREVALKLISESAQRDQAMIVVDEGRLLAKVRHRGVVTVFGAARAGGFAGLWMELIQGATFEEIIQQQGRFSAREAALFGAEVAEALAAVHSAGLLHRDVKAQNVMRDRSGRVVLMDFGTGRVRELPDEAAVADLAGTPLYMAPELFSGGPAATQTDVYSVGVLLFRLVTGSFPLPARSLAEVRLGHEQNRVRRLRDERSDLPSAFVSIVERALSRDPARRYASAGELELALTGFLATSADLSTGSAHGSGSHATPATAAAPAPAVPVPARWTDRVRRAWPLAAMLALGAAAGVAGAWAWLPPRVPVLPTVRFMITPPGTEDFLSFSLAPDGSQVAFTAEGKLWTRPLGSVEARPVADSAGAHDPFWATDSRSVAYFKQNALWVTGIGGGESRYLCPSWNAMGGSWGADGTILFAADFGRAIYRIPGTGGERVPIRLQGEHGTDLRWPSFVPGTSAFIYSSRRAPGKPRTIMVGRLDDAASDQVLLESDANAQIAADRLLFVRNGRLFAQPFDGHSLRLTGTPRPVAGRIGSNLYNREDYANFSAASQGVTLLAYLGARQVDRQLMLIDRQGRATPLIGPGEFRDIAMAPAGDRLAYEQLDEVAGTRDIWTLDVARRQKTRITSDPDDDLAPAWSRDGRWIYFASNRGGRSAMYRHASDGSGGDEIVMADAGGAVPFHISSANLLTFTRQDQRRDNDVWVVPLGPDGLPGEQRTFRASTWRENEPRFSQDGKWIAYSTTDTGDRHVYIERVDTPGPRFQVSVRNGREPFWRADGKEIYYHGPDRWLMAVTIDLSKPTPEIGSPRPLVQLQFRGWDVRYHVAPLPDGSAFVMNVPVPGSTPPPLSFVLNWLTP
jgi:eukaryotic-like serine/threonine-protein kinase